MEHLSDRHSYPAPAKLNLFLHIVGRRDDGMHRLQTLFQLLDYGDTVDCAVRDDGQLVAHCDGVADEDNLALRAAHALRAACATERGAEIKIHKRIPIAAGLGGGSSNAATTLCALNDLWACGLHTEQLADIGATLGADVPLFIRGRSAWGEGLGERLTPVNIAPTWYAVFTPDLRLNTAEQFAHADLERDTPPTSMRDRLRGATRNVFEPVARRRDEVDRLMNWLQARTGGAQLSGSGPSVYAAFNEQAACEACVADAPDEVRAFAARGLNISPLHDKSAVVHNNKQS